jgi:hypothetical protein
MRLFSILCLAACLALPTLRSEALAQQNINVRGTISGFDGKVLMVKSRDGRDLPVDVPDGVNVSVAKAFSPGDIKPGMMLAVTALKRQDGTTVALDVRPLPPTVKASQSNYDLQPGSTMNNLPVEAMATGTSGQELTLTGKDGPMKVVITPQTSFSQSAPGTRADLKPGETVFAGARMEGDKLTATRVQVSKDGVKPGM